MGKSDKKVKILFVCTGNTCRSCLAEAIFKDMVKRGELPVEVQSAGISALPGLAAVTLAMEVAEERGIDLSSHITRPFTHELLKWADLILTLEEPQKNFIASTIPNAIEKTFTLKEYVNQERPSFYFKDLDVADPIGGSKEDYEKCFDEVKAELEKLFKNFKRRAELEISLPVGRQVSRGE